MSSLIPTPMTLRTAAAYLGARTACRPAVPHVAGRVDAIVWRPAADDARADTIRALTCPATRHHRWFIRGERDERPLLWLVRVTPGGLVVCEAEPDGHTQASAWWRTLTGRTPIAARHDAAP
ncbi:hypothetical protein [Actinomadura atramentaria]|uniref:hypothetical protein n=1 Tax=Actinomadura atramentaria TaxID=1990 RepID=UPI0003783A15|nr:hypothetical protein [Actinomadura atramentaria]